MLLFAGRCHEPLLMWNSCCGALPPRAPGDTSPGPGCGAAAPRRGAGQRPAYRRQAKYSKPEPSRTRRFTWMMCAGEVAGFSST